MGIDKLVHKVHTFRNEPVVTEGNLIVIGAAPENGLTAHLEKPGTFTCDKVLIKMKRDFPLKLGVLQVVESINDPAFDPTDQTRDAILVTGPDERTTIAAVRKLASILKR